LASVLEKFLPGIAAYCKEIGVAQHRPFSCGRLLDGQRVILHTENLHTGIVEQKSVELAPHATAHGTGDPGRSGQKISPTLRQELFYLLSSGGFICKNLERIDRHRFDRHWFGTGTVAAASTPFKQSMENKAEA
jgi:hypothetical protein